jgi:hypothetical protein
MDAVVTRSHQSFDPMMDSPHSLTRHEHRQPNDPVDQPQNTLLVRLEKTVHVARNVPLGTRNAEEGVENVGMHCVEVEAKAGVADSIVVGVTVLRAVMDSTHGPQAYINHL